ncbi:MAG TPA: 30S ribosomal protein S20 [Chloroflexota bacterium]
MANTKSAIKRQKIAEKRHARNVAVKSATRTYVKKARTAVSTSAAEAQSDLLAAISALDRAAKKGVIHRNNAARRKSRLMKAFNAANAPVAAEPEPAPAPEAPAPKPKRASRARSAAK